MQSTSSSSSDQQQQPPPSQQHTQRAQTPTASPAAVQPPLPTAQHWMPPMHYPMLMQQHQMMPQHYPSPPPPHYMAAYPPPNSPFLPPCPRPFGHYHYPHRYSQHRNHHNNVGNNSSDNKTLWIGDLHHWMDEQYLHSCFAPSNKITSAKIIRNKHTGLSEGYGFIEFSSHTTAEKVLQTFAGDMMPKTEQPFRLNWATFSSGDNRRSEHDGSDLSIFVGDLAADVTDSLLHETFSSKYPSIKAAKVVIDANTGRSKGYGFVRFGDDSERSQAMTEMNGVYCSTRPMRIGPATPRKSLGYQQANGAFGQGSQSDGVLTNTTVSILSDPSSSATIFVGGLDAGVTDDDLRQPFAQFGEIVSVKIPVGKGCGFVQFANRGNAEEALQKLSGTVIGKQTVRLSWGRSPANKQMRNDFANQWNGGLYYGGPVFDGYGYAMAHPQDPSMYGASYGAYPMYGNQQQVS